MTEKIQQTVSTAVLTLLKPLVKILLRNGIAYGSFAELAKKIYVDVAFDEFAPEKKKQTISRVSALTGLTRKEAKRFHELESSNTQESEQRYNRAIRVISGWVNDPEFHDAQGQLAELPVEGEKGSFASLARKYSGDVPTQSMLAVLTVASCIEKTGDRVRLIRHAYVPGNDAAEKLSILGTDTAELISTIDHNLVCEESALRFQRKVSNSQISAESLPEFQALSAQKAQALLEELDAWLDRHETGSDTQESGQGRYVSLGIYYHEKSGDEEDSS
jgi:ribosomal protein L7/L12